MTAATAEELAFVFGLCVLRSTEFTTIFSIWLSNKLTGFWFVVGPSFVAGDEITPLVGISEIN